MDYKEKLRLAKEALDSGSYDKETIEYIFPELTESKDKRIKKSLIRLVKSFYDVNFPTPEGFERKDIIAWLEKKGEPVEINPTEFDTRLQTLIGKFDSLPKEELIGSLSFWINVIQNDGTYKSDEKHGEQKLVDKIEPKFKVGDWVVFNDKHESVYQIEKAENYQYTIRHILGGSMPLPYSSEDMLRLWTIEDTKDGDVVVDKSDGTIGIFQSIGSHPDGGCYNDTSYCFLHCHCEDEFFYADFENGNEIDSDDLVPATKEQRNLLFQKMKEAGYEWDAEKKELKKLREE